MTTGHMYHVNGNVYGKTNICYRTSVGYIIENADLDADRLPHLWETTHFESLRYNSDDDPDDDGSTSAEEYATGTNPMDPSYFFAITDIELIISSGDQRAHGTWTTVNCRSYQFYYCDEGYSVTMNWLTCESSGAGDGNPNTFIDSGKGGRLSPLAPSAGHHYHRIEVQ